MKKTIIICSMLALTCIAHAQTASDNAHVWNGNDNTSGKLAVKTGNEFAATEMSLNEGKLTFSGLPGLSRPISAVITDGTGDFVKQSKIDQENNTMDVRHLHTGRLYFVTLVYRNTSKKAFTLNM